tara:strand:- start:147 stop:518 length:372 start_codon:yes stop_codon:yes gene_type:complete
MNIDGEKLLADLKYRREAMIKSSARQKKRGHTSAAISHLDQANELAEVIMLINGGDYYTTKDGQEIAPVSEPEWVGEDVQEIIKAVAHIGIDWGYGVYELEQDKIDKARVLYERKLPTKDGQS